MASEFTTPAMFGELALFSGRMKGQDLTVLGRFEGDLDLTGFLRIGRQAVVKAVVRAAAVEVEGEFEGEIRARRLAFWETARAKGVFLAERLSMREGALVEGAVNLPPPMAVELAQDAAEDEGPGGDADPDGPTSGATEPARATADAG